MKRIDKKEAGNDPRPRRTPTRRKRALSSIRRCYLRNRKAGGISRRRATDKGDSLKMGDSLFICARPDNFFFTAIEEPFFRVIEVLLSSLTVCSFLRR